MGSASSTSTTRSAVTSGSINSENSVHVKHSELTDCKTLSNIEIDDRKSDTGKLSIETNSEDGRCIDEKSSDENGTKSDSEDKEQTFESCRKEILDALENGIKNTKSFESIINEKGGIRKEVSNLMHVIDVSADLPYRDIAKSKDIASYRIEICKILTENKIAHIMYDVLNHIYGRWKSKSNSSLDADTYNILDRDLGSLQNITDGSETFCVTVCMVAGFLKLMKTILDEHGNTLLYTLENVSTWLEKLIAWSPKVLLLLTTL